MTPALVITPAAELDIAEAIEWYDSIHSTLSSDFRLALTDAFQRITQHPRAYAALPRGLHRAFLRRFSHGIYYRQGLQVIQVIAVLHTSRSPRIWQARNH